MAEFSRLGLWWLLNFLQPAHYRILVRTLYEWAPLSVLEAAAPKLAWSHLLLRVMRHATPNARLRYVGTGMFEAAGGPGVKDVYRTLKGLGAHVILLPGTLHETMPRWANHVGPVDVMILWYPELLRADDPLWFYVPRMLSSQGRVLMERKNDAQIRWAVVSRKEAERRAEAVLRRRAA